MAAVVIAPAAQGRDKHEGDLLATDGVDRVAVDVTEIAGVAIGLAGSGGHITIAGARPLNRDVAPAEHQSGSEQRRRQPSGNDRSPGPVQAVGCRLAGLS
jgi:hypothetical protein